MEGELQVSPQFAKRRIIWSYFALDFSLDLSKPVMPPKRQDRYNITEMYITLPYLGEQGFPAFEVCVLHLSPYYSQVLNFPL